MSDIGLFNSNKLNASSDEESITVSQLNKMAKSALENNLPILWIKGEISGLKTYSHLYFDLKDEGAKISCVMFAKLAAMLDFPLENGTQVEVRGRVTIYPANGSYQINVERVRKVGLGALWEAYAKLINKLRDEGLFDSKYKKSIPLFPRAIGVITSKEGAVIRDVVTTLRRRMPNIPVVIYHSAVQGSDASMQLCRAIRTANQRNEVDVLIVCRGGGSMEDLWSFNEEVVAREVFSSHIPIISAVGHETDTTIIDFVADLRAPTPTAAAELVARSRQEWLDILNGFEYRLKNQINGCINYKQQQLDLIYARLRAVNPIMNLQMKKQAISELEIKLKRAMVLLVANKQQQVNELGISLSYLKPNFSNHLQNVSFLSMRLKNAINVYCHNSQQRLENCNLRLKSLNPESILERGYAIVRDNKGKVVKSANQIKHHTKLLITLGDGEVAAIANRDANSLQEELL